MTQVSGYQEGMNVPLRGVPRMPTLLTMSQLRENGQNIGLCL